MRIKMPKHGAVPVSLLLEPSLTLSDLKVYTALASFQGHDDEAFPSREAIVGRCGCVLETVSRSVGHLIELGWIQRIRRPNQSSIYRVLMETEEISEMTAPSLPPEVGNDRPVTTEMTAPSLPSIKQKDHSKKTASFPVDSQPFILAELLMTEHRKHDSRFIIGEEERTLQRWAKDIDKLIRLNQRTPEEIRRVIRWCQSPGCFWIPNILSGAKLREKFPTLLVQSMNGKGAPRLSGVNHDPSRPAYEERAM